MSFETRTASLPRRGGAIDPVHTSRATMGASDFIALAVGAFMMLIPLAMTAYGNPYSSTNFIGMKMPRS